LKQQKTMQVKIDRFVEQPEGLARVADRRGIAAFVTGVERWLAVPLEQNPGQGQVDFGRDLKRFE
jgi:hypothetical protein